MSFWNKSVKFGHERTTYLWYQRRLHICRTHSFVFGHCTSINGKSMMLGWKSLKVCKTKWERGMISGLSSTTGSGFEGLRRTPQYLTSLGCPPHPLPRPDGFCIGAVESLTTVLIWDAFNWKYYIEIYFWAWKVACFIPNLERTIHFLMKLQAYSCRKRKFQCAKKITVKILTRAYDVRFGKELNWEPTNYPRELKMPLMTMQMITKDS